MEGRELNKQILPLYGVVCMGMAILLCLTLTLSIGDAYGRYCKTVSGTMSYSAGLKDRVWVMGLRNAEQVGGELPTEWTKSDESDFIRSLSLCVSNSDRNGVDRAIEDQTIRLRLYLPDSVYESAAMQITLQIEDNNRTYIATKDYLSPSSAAAKEIGASGWIYTFCDASGNELTWVLKGGKVADLNVTFTATEVTSTLGDYRLLVDILHEDTSLTSVLQGG